MVKIRIILMLVSAIIALNSCVTYTDLVRTQYHKISSLSEETNFEKMAGSSFNNYTIYKAKLKSDFNIQYFSSYRASYYINYYFGFYSFDVDIYSSWLGVGDSFIQMGNPFDNHYTETATGKNLHLFLLSDEIILSKEFYFEMEIENSLLSSPGIYKSRGSRQPVFLMIKNRDNQMLFSSSAGAESFLNFEVVEIKESILYGTYSGKLGSVSNDETIYYDIYDGEIWIKL